MDNLSNQLENRPSNGNSQPIIKPAKEELTKYIHDVADMETRIFTIDKTIEYGKKRISDDRKRLDADFRSVSDTYNRAKTATKSAKEKWENEKQTADNWEECFTEKLPQKKKVIEDTRFNAFKIVFSIIGAYLGLVVIYFSSLLVLASSSEIDSEFSNSSILGVMGIFFGLFLITAMVVAGILIDKKRRKNYQINVFPKQCAKAESDYIAAVQKYNEDKEAFRQSKEQDVHDAYLFFRTKEREELMAVEKFKATKDRLAQNSENEKAFQAEVEKIIPLREKLSIQMHKLYSFNIIPPDYREVDCTLMFDQIFRNDLADNMREAIMIYEERIFRGDVIRGMNRIYDMLGNLNAGMMQMNHTLESIHQQVNFMGEDLCQLVSLSEQTLEQQDNILRESQLNRYTSEAIQRNTDAMEYYTRVWYNQNT